MNAHSLLERASVLIHFPFWYSKGPWLIYNGDFYIPFYIETYDDVHSDDSAALGALSSTYLHSMCQACA